MKRKPILIILILLLAVTLVFTACSKKKNNVPVPANLSIENNVFTWDAVPGTITYDVKIDETVYPDIETNRFPLPITDTEDHEVTVRANTYDGTGNYAPSLTYRRSQPKTVLPQLPSPRVTMTGNRVMWNTILNNNGYKINFDGKSYLTEKNATYYDLTFTKEGRFEITMETVGDGVTYASSLVSSPYSVTVFTDPKTNKLTAKLLALPQTEFSFNAETLLLEWRNAYSADAVSYEIYKDNDLTTPYLTIPADQTKAKMTFDPEPSGIKVTYTMRLISNNGLYDPSPFGASVSFPFADSAPSGLTIAVEEELGGYYIEWDACTYLDGYVAEIDGVSYPVEQNKIKIPSTLSVGRHVVRVKTMGAGTYYKDSLLSGGIVFYTEDGGKIARCLSTPEKPILSLNEGALEVIALEIPHAENYRFVFRGKSGSGELVLTQRKFLLTQTAIDDRALTTEEATVVARIFADLPTGVFVSVCALTSESLYKNSLLSEESWVCSDTNSLCIVAPLSFKFDHEGISWDRADEYTYELMLDGVPYEMSDSPSLSITEGEHVMRLRVKEDNALWTKEIAFRYPIDTPAPSGLSVSSGIFSFKGTDGASGYILYVDGEAIGVFYPTEQRVLISDYIQIDGSYVLELVAKAGADGALDSPHSEQYLYVKTDGDYGTAAKPYTPTDAENLMSLMLAHPDASFSLSTSYSYDFSSYNFSAQKDLDFSGNIWGNGATLTGLDLSSPFFATLKKATIRNLTMVIDCDDFFFAETGVLARSIQETVLNGVEFRISGDGIYTRELNFGVLCYDATDLTIKDCSIECDLSWNNRESCGIGTVAYTLTGNISGLNLLGQMTVRAKNLRFGAVAVSGEMTVSGLRSGLNVAATAIGYATVSGCTAEGILTASDFNTNTLFAVESPILTYYGAARDGATLTSCTIGGEIRATKSNDMTLFGAVDSDAKSLKLVKVTTHLVGSAKQKLSVAGIANVIPNNCDTTGASFEGAIEAEAPNLTAVGCAVTIQGEHALTSKGQITLCGVEEGSYESTEIEVSAGAIDAQTMTLANDSKITLSRVSYAKIAGAALTASGTVSVSGTQEVVVSDCEEVLLGGVLLNGAQTLAINGYKLIGSVSADRMEVAGASSGGTEVTILALDLAVDLALTADEIEAAGALLRVDSLTLSSGGTMSSKITGQGNALLAGFALDVGNNRLSNLSLSGNLKLVGEGSMYGVTKTAGNASFITSSVGLEGEGDVQAFGLFENVAAAGDLALENCTVKLTGDRVSFVGVADRVAGAFERVRVSALDLRANPVHPTVSSLQVFGLVKTLASLTTATVDQNTAYTIGNYHEFTFGGIADTMAATGTSDATLQSAAISYSLTSSAASATIGGVFVSGRGVISSLAIGNSAPVSVTSSGETAFGGVFAEPSDLALSSGSATLSLTLDLPQDSTSRIGGLFSVLKSGRQATISAFSVNLTAARSGDGTAYVGGCVGASEGTLIGATADVSLTSTHPADVFGGVAASSYHASFESCFAKGNITAEGVIGGVIGDVQGGSLNGVGSALTITSQHGAAGGLFGSADGAMVNGAYSLSRLYEQGSGLVANAKNLSLTNCYFAGNVTEYSIAESALNCSSSNLFIDASLSNLAAFGNLDHPAYSMRSFGYGYTSDELGDRFTTDGQRYPYLTALGYPFASAASVTTKNLVLETPITGDLDLYAEGLPRVLDLSTPSVTWVDVTGNLEIREGVATVVDSINDGKGILHGYLAGGVLAYVVSYDSSGFVPFAGTGIESDPYLLTDLKYFRYVKTYCGADVYFKSVIESEAVEAAFAECFTAEEPFRGHFDFNGLRLVDATFGEGGIFGYLDHAEIKNLVFEGRIGGVLLASSATNSTISNITFAEAEAFGNVRLIGNAQTSALRKVTAEQISVAGNFRLIDTATDCTIGKITMVVSASSALDFALIDAMTGGSASEISLAVTMNSSEAFRSFVVCESENVAFEKVQAMNVATLSERCRIALAQSDVDSTFTGCMLIFDGHVSEVEESEIAGLVFTSSGSSFVGCAVLVRAGNVALYPLIKEGTASYLDTLLFSDKSVVAPAGVSVKTATEIAAALALQSGYVTEYIVEENPVLETIATPLGYHLFAESAEASIELLQEELVINGSQELASLLTVFGSKPLAGIVCYEWDDDSAGCAVIENGVLRVKKEGSGLLTVTNMYGETQSIEVTIEDFVGFANGTGSSDDPYLITDEEEFLRIAAFTDNEKYYRIANDIALTLTEPMVQYGTWLGSGVTVTVTLGEGADYLFREAFGVIDGVNFVINKASVAFEAQESENPGSIFNPGLMRAGVGGLFAVEARGSILQNLTLTLNIQEVTLSDHMTFGLLIGRATSEATFKNLVAVISECTVTVGSDSTVGVLVGEAQGSVFDNVTLSDLSGNITVVGSGSVIVGTVGVLNASEATYMSYDPLTESESESYYVDGVTVNLSMTASADTLVLGGFAGRSNVDIRNLTMVVDLALTGGDVTVGGAVGASMAKLIGANVTANIVTAMDAPVDSACVGGAIGEVGEEVQGGSVNAVLTIHAKGKTLVGGLVGSGSGTLSDTVITANITAHSLADADALLALRGEETGVLNLVAAGGVAGDLSAIVNGVSVTVIAVNASADYAGIDCTVYAGGVAGIADGAESVTVTGGTNVSASGGASTAAESVAVYTDDLK